ncbi:uncharacterized protein [Clytia hemisphaerica]|uniref:Uncharacterized protein n=1 Tax=Clytia hemisphaerica TaxID=252671 RepID=A0A7M6DMF2_9CNID
MEFYHKYYWIITVMLTSFFIFCVVDGLSIVQSGSKDTKDLTALLKVKRDRDNVTCQNLYKVYWLVKKDQFSVASPKQNINYVIQACKPDITNLFCADESNDQIWTAVRFCDVIPNSDFIVCKIFPKGFESYNHFANWTMESFIYKVRGEDAGKSVQMNTKSLVITPFYRCPRIKLVRPSHQLFN